MNHLLGVTLLWAFSFSLIGVYLAGQVDAYFSVLTRIVLAALVFLPFIRWRQVRPALAVKLMAIGAVQLKRDLILNMTGRYVRVFRSLRLRLFVKSHRQFRSFKRAL